MEFRLIKLRKNEKDNKFNYNNRSVFNVNLLDVQWMGRKERNKSYKDNIHTMLLMLQAKKPFKSIIYGLET